MVIFEEVYKLYKLMVWMIEEIYKEEGHQKM